MKNYHVVHREDGQWVAIKEGASRAASVHSTQKNAISAARVLVKKSNGELRIHTADGHIRGGSEPRPKQSGAAKPSLENETATRKAAFAQALGERLASARKMRGHSLRSLADTLSDLSHTTLQKFEKGIAVPDSKVLSGIANALDVRMSYFLKTPRYSFTGVEWRKAAKVGLKIQRQLEFEALDYFQRYLEIEALLSIECRAFHSKDLSAFSLEEIPQAIEELVGELRARWGLGSNPLPNVHRMLEDQGVKVRVLPGSKGYDGLASYLEGNSRKVPVIALSDEHWKNNKDLPRFRFSALHELGHLAMQLPEGLEHRIKEGFCHRFASAFIFPKERFIGALGSRRHKLPITEAKELKAIWGMSISAIIRRAKDLDVITQGAYKGFCIWNNSPKGFGKEEPQSWIGSEDSDRFKQLVLRAFSEEVISSSKAADLLGVSLGQLAAESDSLI